MVRARTTRTPAHGAPWNPTHHTTEDHMGQARRITPKAQREKNKVRALELMSMGLTNREIFHDLGYRSPNSARNLIMEALKEHAAPWAEEVHHMRHQEALKLEAIERTLLREVVGKDLNAMTDQQNTQSSKP